MKGFDCSTPLLKITTYFQPKNDNNELYFLIFG